MPRTLNRLKPLAVERTKTPGRYADGGGLYLIVKPGPRTRLSSVKLPTVATARPRLMDGERSSWHADTIRRSRAW